MKSDKITRRQAMAVAGVASVAAATSQVYAQDAPKQEKGREATKENIEVEIEHQRKNLPPLPLGTEFVSQNICCSSPVPAGWIKVNDHWSPTSCGNPTSIVYNVCTIEKFSDKPVGAQMNVCASAPTPTGWVVVNTYWSPTSCGRPTSIVHNMKRIKRLS